MYTTTASATQTINARRVASKVGADLKRMQRLVGLGIPTDEQIDAYEKEAALLLQNGYLKEVSYGFISKTSRKWHRAIKYEAYYGQLSGGGDHPGDILPKNASNCYFGSFLIFSQKWENLTAFEKEEIEKRLPLKRTDGVDPEVEGGNPWVYNNRRYSSGEINLKRAMVGFD